MASQAAPPRLPAMNGRANFLGISPGASVIAAGGEPICRNRDLGFHIQRLAPSVGRVGSKFLGIPVSSSAPNHIASRVSLTVWNLLPKNNPQRLPKHLLRGRIGPRRAPNHRGG